MMLSIECFYSTLKYETTSNLISGDVLVDHLTIFVLIVDDNTPEISPEYIISNGIIQGKFTKGSRWEVHTDTFNKFPGSMYILGVYSNNQCHTKPLYINLPLNSCIQYKYCVIVDVIGSEVSFEATYVKMNNELQIIMRGNSVMETQYYLLYKDDDSYVLDSELFSDENNIGL